MGRVVTRRATTAAPALSPTALKSKAIACLTLLAEEKAAKERSGILKKELMDTLHTSGEPDDKGHRYLYFANPITVGGKAIKGIKREKRVSTSFDEQVAEDILTKHEGLLERATVTVTETRIDQDEIYVLNQEGLLSDEEVDQMMVKSETYAFKPVTD